MQIGGDAAPAGVHAFNTSDVFDSRPPALTSLDCDARYDVCKLRQQEREMAVQRDGGVAGREWKEAWVTNRTAEWIELAKNESALTDRRMQLAANRIAKHEREEEQAMIKLAEKYMRQDADAVERGRYNKPWLTPRQAKANSDPGVFNRPVPRAAPKTAR